MKLYEVEKINFINDNSKMSHVFFVKSSYLQLRGLNEAQKA